MKDRSGGQHHLGCVPHHTEEGASSFDPPISTHTLQRTCVLQDQLLGLLSWRLVLCSHLTRSFIVLQVVFRAH